jgi:hypothetical protein
MTTNLILFFGSFILIVLLLIAYQWSNKKDSTFIVVPRRGDYLYPIYGPPNTWVDYWYYPPRTPIHKHPKYHKRTLSDKTGVAMMHVPKSGLGHPLTYQWPNQKPITVQKKQH